MKAFFRNLLAALVALAVFSGGAVLLFFIVMASMAPAPPVVPKKAVLVFNLDRAIPDSTQEGTPGELIQKAMRNDDSEGTPLRALIKALEARGYGVLVGVGDTKGTTVKVLGETLNIWLEEQVDRTERPLTDEEKGQMDEFIAALAAGAQGEDGGLNLWVGPLNFQDGTPFLADGQVATPKQIWFQASNADEATSPDEVTPPQLLEGITGASQ